MSIRPIAVSATASAALALALGVVVPAATADADLIHLEVQRERGAGNGDDSVDAAFDEVERGADLSRARVQAGAGGAASVAMFVVRGFCAVAESRGVAFFRPRPGREASDGDWLYAAEFADERMAVTPAREPAATLRAPEFPGAASGERGDGVFSIGDCRLLGFLR